jgi:hypothetical protein
MKGWFLAGMIGLCLTAFSGNRKAEPRQEDGWLTDYAAARAVASSAGKPLFVVFR